MKKIRKSVLVITNNSSLSALTHPDWEISVARPGEEPIEVVQRQSFDLIMMDLNADPTLIRKLKAVMPLLSTEVEIHDFKTCDGLEHAISMLFDQQKQLRLSKIAVTDTMDF